LATVGCVRHPATTYWPRSWRGCDDCPHQANTRQKINTADQKSIQTIDPELHVPSCGLRRYCVIDELARRLAGCAGLVARIARELVARCRELTVQINALERELRDRVRVLAPTLLEVPGCGVLGAAVIIGETAGAQRYASAVSRGRPVRAGNPFIGADQLQNDVVAFGGVIALVEQPVGEPALDLVAREKDYAQQLQREGKWPHLWRIAGEYANFSVFDVESNDELHDLLSALPLFPYLDISVTAPVRHPSKVE
jgi:muconolactone delta-isomerase